MSANLPNGGENEDVHSSDEQLPPDPDTTERIAKTRDLQRSKINDLLNNTDIDDRMRSPQYYAVLDEAAQYLGMSEEELMKLREDKMIRGYQDRGYWKFKGTDLHELKQQIIIDEENPQSLEPGKFYSLEEAAKYLHITPEELQALRNSSVIRGFPDNDSFRFKGIDLIKHKTKSKEEEEHDDKIENMHNNDTADDNIIDVEFKVTAHDTNADRTERESEIEAEEGEESEVVNEPDVLTESMSSTEAATYFSIDESEILILHSKGELRGKMVNGEWQFNKQELETYLKNKSKREVPVSDVNSQPVDQDSSTKDNASQDTTQTWWTRFTSRFSKKTRSTTTQKESTTTDINANELVYGTADTQRKSPSELRSAIDKQKQTVLNTLDSKTDEQEKKEVAKAIDDFNMFYMEWQQATQLLSTLENTTLTISNREEGITTLNRLNLAIERVVHTYSTYADPSTYPILDTVAEQNILLPRLEWLIKELQVFVQKTRGVSAAFRLGKILKNNGKQQENYIQSTLQRIIKAQQLYKANLPGEKE